MDDWEVEITGWKQYDCHLCRASLVPAASPSALVPALLRDAGDTDGASLCLHRAPQEGGAWVGWRGGVVGRPGNPPLWLKAKAKILEIPQNS